MSPATHLYGCNGRERPAGKKLMVQNGWIEFDQNGVMVRGLPRWEWIDTAPAPVCISGSFSDSGCTGCAHRRNP